MPRIDFGGVRKKPDGHHSDVDRKMRFAPSRSAPDTDDDDEGEEAQEDGEEQEQEESEEEIDQVDVARKCAKSSLSKLDKRLLEVPADVNKTKGKDRLLSQRTHAESVIKQMRSTKTKLEVLVTSKNLDGTTMEKKTEETTLLIDGA